MVAPRDKHAGQGNFFTVQKNHRNIVADVFFSIYVFKLADCYLCFHKKLHNR